MQRNTVIALLQEQVHEVQVDLDDAMAHIGMLHEYPIPPVVPAESAAAEEDPEEIEGVSEIDSEHAPAEPNPQPDDSFSGSVDSEHAPAEPNPQPDDSFSGSASPLGNLDDF